MDLKGLFQPRYHYVLTPKTKESLKSYLHEIRRLGTETEKKKKNPSFLPTSSVPNEQTDQICSPVVFEHVSVQ